MWEKKRIGKVNLLYTSLFILRFAYQKLRGYRPVFRARTAEIFFFLAGTLLLALGIPILIASVNIQEIKTRYDDKGLMENLTNSAREDALWQAGDEGVQYSIPVNITETLKPPIWVVIELNTFFQNYRRYVRSYDAQQMHDNGSAIPGASACEPFQFVGNSEDSSLLADGAIVPCGQIAHSNFNDTYSLSLDGQPIEIDDSDIAWSSDRKHLYGPVEPINYNIYPPARGGNTSSTVLNENQHWMVWMRPGAKRVVQKLYGKLNQPLSAGSSLDIAVQNRYNTYAFGSEKKIILTTNSWVGGKNIFLPIFYLVASFLCYATTIFFLLGYDAGLIRKRRWGSEDDFSWVRQTANQKA